jgi:hypothetical protein
LKPEEPESQAPAIQYSVAGLINDIIGIEKELMLVD